MSYEFGHPDPDEALLVAEKLADLTHNKRHMMINPSSKPRLCIPGLRSLQRHFVNVAITLAEVWPAELRPLGQ